MNVRTGILWGWFVLLALLVTACAPIQARTDSQRALAVIVDRTGTELGRVSIASDDDEQIMVTANINGLAPGFHGFHIHGTGLCDHSTETPFSSAAGHLQVGDTVAHPNHAGDLPALLVMADGSAELSFVTDRFSMADILDEDGAAVVIHAGPDNYANIPERYALADEATLGAGDAGGRAACGVFALDTEG